MRVLAEGEDVQMTTSVHSSMAAIEVAQNSFSKSFSFEIRLLAPFHAQRLGLRLGRAPQASVSVSRAWMMGALSA